MSHNSLVHTPVNAAGKNSSTVFFLPKLSLNFTSSRPAACLDFNVKSGALVPTDSAINIFQLSFVLFGGSYKRGAKPCQTATQASTRNTHRARTKSARFSGCHRI